MQIVGGRWEVCLGDGSCVLSFLSFPSACVNLYIMVQLCSPGPGPALFPTDCWPEGALSSLPHVPARSLCKNRPNGLTSQASHCLTYTRVYWKSVYLVLLTQLKIGVFFFIW